MIQQPTSGCWVNLPNNELQTATSLMSVKVLLDSCSKYFLLRRGIRAQLYDKYCKREQQSISKKDEEQTSFAGVHRDLEPPDPIPNSEVKRVIADDSVGPPHVKVGQGLFLWARLYTLS